MHPHIQDTLPHLDIILHDSTGTNDFPKKLLIGLNSSQPGSNIYIVTKHYFPGVVAPREPYGTLSLSFYANTIEG